MKALTALLLALGTTTALANEAWLQRSLHMLEQATKASPDPLLVPPTDAQVAIAKQQSGHLETLGEIRPPQDMETIADRSLQGGALTRRHASS